VRGYCYLLPPRQFEYAAIPHIQHKYTDLIVTFCWRWWWCCCCCCRWAKGENNGRMRYFLPPCVIVRIFSIGCLDLLCFVFGFFFSYGFQTGFQNWVIRCGVEQGETRSLWSVTNSRTRGQPEAATVAQKLAERNSGTCGSRGSVIGRMARENPTTISSLQSVTGAVCGLSWLVNIGNTAVAEHAAAALAYVVCAAARCVVTPINRLAWFDLLNVLHLCEGNMNSTW